MTEDLASYIAITIAESRIKKAKDAARLRLLQACQLEDDSRLVDMADGVVSDFVECPACSDDVAEGWDGGVIEVPAPFGLEAGEMALPSVVNLTNITDDVLIWGVTHGVLKLSVDTKSFDSYAKENSDEAKYMMTKIGSALSPRSTAVLRVIAPAKLKEAQ